MTYEKEQTIAIQACLQAAKLCQRVRVTIPKAIEKLDQSPVTVRDKYFHRKYLTFIEVFS